MLRRLFFGTAHLCAAVLLLALLLCGVEVALRILTVVQPPQGSASSTMVIPSWTTYQQLPAGGRLRLGHEMVVLNRLGMRGPEPAAPPSPAAVRLLLLGDDLAFGADVEEQFLASTGLSLGLTDQQGRPVECLNGSWPGATPTTQLIALRTQWAALGVDGVILQLSRSRFVAEAKLQRRVRMDADGFPVACPHPRLNLNQSTDRFQECRNQFRTLQLLCDWAGRQWKSEAELASEESVNPDSLQAERHIEPVLELWQRWTEQQQIKLILLCSPSARERQQLARGQLPDWMRAVQSWSRDRQVSLATLDQPLVGADGQAPQTRAEAARLWHQRAADKIENLLTAEALVRRAGGTNDRTRQQLGGEQKTGMGTTGVLPAGYRSAGSVRDTR